MKQGLTVDTIFRGLHATQNAPEFVTCKHVSVNWDHVAFVYNVEAGKV